MGFRFRRSVRVFPGVRLNVSKSGISTSIGVRGASVTIGPRGSRVNVGIPGTGLSYTQTLSRGKGQAPRRRDAGLDDLIEMPEIGTPDLDPIELPGPSTPQSVRSVP